MLHTIRVWVFGCNVNVRLQEEGVTQRYLIIEKLRADRFYFFWLDDIRKMESDEKGIPTASQETW